MTRISRKAALAVPMAAIALAASISAHAAPVVQSPDAFYAHPASIPAGQHGDLLAFRVASPKLGADAPATNAWNVKYLSQNADEEATVATGTVLVPTTAWSGTGPRPVILYAVGTHGLGNACAPSKQFEAGTDYENANISAALKAGYAVLVTDYVGYTTGETPRYMAGPSQGRNVLDMLKAAQGIPSVGIAADAQVAIWGYSQGGQAAAFAAELQASYVPGMKVVGVAQGGTPGDLVPTTNYLNDRNGSAFMLKAILGLYEEYPTGMPFDLAVSDFGRSESEKIKQQCIFRALFEYQNRDLQEFTKPTFTLDKLLNLNSVKGTLEEQRLGKVKVAFPMYQYHGKADEFIPLPQAYDLKKRYCANGTNVTFDLYPSEHIATQFQGAPAALAFLGARFKGESVGTNSCSSSKPDPVPTAEDNTGNLKVKLDAWKLYAKVDLKTLNQSVILPETSTFSAMTDINAKTLDGSMVIPQFSQSLKLLGIGAQIGMRIVPEGPIVGSVALDEQGQLSVKGEAKVNITIASVWGIPFGECKTQTPVSFPLDFKGPISSLGNGNLTFTGTTSFPMIKGCIISAIVSAFMTGPGQKYTFTVSPPAPVRY